MANSLRYPMTQDQELAYLAAFFDGEGYVLCKRQCSDKKIGRRIGFTNTDKSLFNTVISMLQRAGFELSISERTMANPKHTNRWDCHIKGGRKGFERFASLIPLQHEGKKKRLASIVSGYLTLDQANRNRALSRSQSLTPERRHEISKLALASRWKDHDLTSAKRIRIYTQEQKERRKL